MQQKHLKGGENNNNREASYIKSTEAYRFLIGKQLFSNPEEVFSILTESFNEAFLRQKQKQNVRDGGISLSRSTEVGVPSLGGEIT